MKYSRNSKYCCCWVSSVNGLYLCFINRVNHSFVGNKFSFFLLLAWHFIYSSILLLHHLLSQRLLDTFLPSLHCPLSCPSMASLNTLIWVKKKYHLHCIVVWAWFTSFFFSHLVLLRLNRQRSKKSKLRKDWHSLSLSLSPVLCHTYSLKSARDTKVERDSDADKKENWSWYFTGNFEFSPLPLSFHSLINTDTRNEKRTREKENFS